MISIRNKQVVPVNIICGALGAGKTTAIAKLLANKPSHESWVVILNEFTDTGIDTLTLATAARGSYDVRMIPGGCLCCTGEEDFRRQLSALLANEALPTRILIEPSGIGHPGSVIEELRGFERSGAIRLLSAIALIEPQQIENLDAMTTTMRNQIDVADVVLLSKAELADANVREHFASWARELFPLKRFIGFSEQGVLPKLALFPPNAAFSFFNQASSHHHVHDVALVSRTVKIANFVTHAKTHHYLGRHACGWVFSNEIIFDTNKIESWFANDNVLFKNVERFKAVLRTGIDRWHLIQRWSNQFELREIAWRQDSRVEVQMKENVKVDWDQWDIWWQSMTID